MYRNQEKSVKKSEIMDKNPPILKSRTLFQPVSDPSHGPHEVHQEIFVIQHLHKPLLGLPGIQALQLGA